jgi:Na+/proline symporter
VQYLNGIDYSIIVVYFCCLIGLGLYLQKRASVSIEDYFIGGRSIPWWALGISGMASWIDITGTMLIVSLLFMVGPRALFIEFRGAAQLLLVFFLLWTGKWHRRSGCITGGEWMVFRFGDGWQGRAAQFLQVLAVIVISIGMLAYLTKGVGLFLSMFLPFSPLTCSLIMIIVATIYTMISGFYGVVFTDVFQAAIIILAVIFITANAVMMVDGLVSLQSIAKSVTGSKDWVKSYPTLHENLPKGYEVYQNLVMFTLLSFIKTCFLGFGSGSDPKFFGARNDRECGLIAFVWTWCVSLRWPLMISFAVLGLFMVKEIFPNQTTVSQASQIIKTQYPDTKETEWPTLISSIVNHPEKHDMRLIEKLRASLGNDNWDVKMKLLGYNQTVNHECILPAVLVYSIRPGMRGLFLIALVAASMSSFDTSVNRATGLFIRDVYQKHIRPTASNKELIRASWISVVFITLFAVAFGYSLKSINNIYSWIVMGLGSGLAIPIAIKLYWWRFNGGGFAIGTAFGLIGAIILRLFWSDLNEMLQFVYMLIVGLIGTVVGTYITKPTDMEVLKNFYTKTRPFGFWKPLYHMLPSEEQKSMKAEHRRDILGIPFALVWQVSLFLLPMQLILKTYSAFMVTFILFVVGLIGLYFFWYKNLPSKTNN